MPRPKNFHTESSLSLAFFHCSRKLVKLEDVIENLEIFNYNRLVTQGATEVFNSICGLSRCCSHDLEQVETTRGHRFTDCIILYSSE